MQHPCGGGPAPTQDAPAGARGASEAYSSGCRHRRRGRPALEPAAAARGRWERWAVRPTAARLAQPSGAGAQVKDALCRDLAGWRNDDARPPACLFPLESSPRPPLTLCRRLALAAAALAAAAVAILAPAPYVLSHPAGLRVALGVLNALGPATLHADSVSAGWWQPLVVEGLYIAERPPRAAAGAV